MKNDFDWGLAARDDDYLEHHQVKGGKWGVMHGPPYPLSRTGNYSPEQRRAAKADGRQLPKRNKKVVNAGAVEGSGRKPGAKSSPPVSTSSTTGSSKPKTSEVQLSKKTKKLQKKAADYAKSMHLSNDYNATKVKNSSGENKDTEKFVTNMTVNKLGAMKLYDMKLRAEESERKDAETFSKSHSNDKISETNAGDSLGVDVKLGGNEVHVNKNDFSESWDNNDSKDRAQNNEPKSNSGIQRQETVRQPSRHQDAYDVAHKKPVSMMTDDEIAAANNRLIAEQNLKKNRIATYNVGQKFLHDAGTKLYDQILMPTMMNVAAFETNKFMSDVLKTPWPSDSSTIKIQQPQSNNNGGNNNNQQQKQKGNNNNQNNNNQNNQNQKKKSPMDAS